MGVVQRQILRRVLGVVARPRLTLAVCGAALIACLALAYLRLDISTDQNKLFDPDVKFFADYSMCRLSGWRSRAFGQGW